MSALIIIFTVFCLYGLNVGAMPFLSVFGAIPNFLIIYTIIFSFETKSFFPPLFMALLSGMLLDYGSEVFFGSFLLALFFSIFILRFFTTKLFILERNKKNTLIIFIIFFVFIYFFAALYNYYAWRLGFGHFQIFPGNKDLFLRYIAELAYSMPFVFLFRKLIYLQIGYINRHFYANTKKTF